MSRWDRGWLPALGLVAMTAVLLAPAAAAAKGGSIQIYVTGTTLTTPILVTGAITDYGKATSVTSAGKPDENGNYEKVVLQKGTFWVDATKLNEKLNAATPTIDMARCYFAFKGSGPTTLFKGTGAYAGIKGDVTISLELVSIGPRLANGKCNLKENVRPAAQFETVRGSGTASF